MAVGGGRLGATAMVALPLLLLLPSLAAATCRLPFHFPVGTGPSGATVGPRNSLVIVSDGGTILFADLEDFTVREDTALNDKYRDGYGWFDLEGVAMTSPESTFLYIGMENKAAVLEYEWHGSHKIFRRFSLAGFEQAGTVGIQSLTWVPTEASKHQGYFYVGSQLTGNIFIYELPLLDDTGPDATAELRSVWTPLKGNKNIAGLSFSSGYIFANYDDGTSNHVLIYPVLATGLPGELKEQYEVDVTNAQGMAVRKAGNGTWEMFFTSDTRQAVFAYTFRFITGFELHGRCAVVTPNPGALPGAGRRACSPGGPLLGFALSILALAALVPLDGGASTVGRPQCLPG
mmetsp:Transcript_74002/g.158611  ORF Transcript_74002/g.158611 Transcript_74002/m.158611 type:complete len:346 (+) Transcript_74002:149-1186(+)